MGLGGCSEKSKPEATRAAKAGDTNNRPVTDATDVTRSMASGEKAPAPTPDQQVCFECQGSGRMACNHSGCHRGFVECPGPCLKRSSKWEHAVVDGHSANELWHVIHLGNRKKQLVSQAHIGEVFVVRQGEVDRLGKCQQCHGRGQLPCPSCKGKATVLCELCEGKLVIPRTWSTNNNPVLNRQPDLIRLKDGRVYLGKRSGELGERAYIRTRDGQLVTVSKDDFESAAPAK